MEQRNRKNFQRIIIAAVVAIVLICGLYILLPDLLRLEERAAARSENPVHLQPSPIAATPVTLGPIITLIPVTFVIPDPPTAPPDPPTAPPDPPTNTPIPPAAPQITPVTEAPPEQPEPPDQTPANTIPTPVTEIPPGPQDNQARPTTIIVPPPSLATPETPTGAALVPSTTHLPWETNCARPTISACVPPWLNVSDLRSEWQEPVRVAARAWTNVLTPFTFAERTFTNSERTLVPMFFGALPFQSIRLAPGEVRFVQLSQIFGPEVVLRPAFDTMFRQRRVIAVALAYQDPKNPGKRLASLVILNDYYPLAYSWTVLPGNLRLDVQSIALHELGHVAGLEHTLTASDVMFSGLEDTALFLSKRTVTSNDRTNLARLYPIPSPGSITPTPDGSAYPPGVHVLSIQPQPENPKRRERVPFSLIFFNSTGSPQRYTMLVQIILRDGHPFGETNAQTILLPLGTSRFTTPDNWGVFGPGGCLDLTARPFFRNEDNSRTQFPGPDGNKASLDFSVCP